jgi:hypothetical protein
MKFIYAFGTLISIVKALTANINQGVIELTDMSLFEEIEKHEFLMV